MIHSLNTYNAACVTCRCLLYLLKNHGHVPQEIDTETLQAVLKEPAEPIV